MPDYRLLAREAAVRHSVPPAMFERQIGRESGFRPDARSPAGALGIAQFMPATAASFGVDPMDPLAALDAAAAYLSRLYGQYGKWSLALAAYNSGPGNVQKYGGVPPFPETRAYLDAILGPGWPEPATSVVPDGTSDVPLGQTMSDRLIVYDDNVNFRPAPGLANTPIQTLRKGSPVWPTGGAEVQADGHVWVPVALGPSGYIAKELLKAEGVRPAGATSRAFDPTTPTYLQQASWTCSIGAVIWCLRSIGIAVTPEEAYDAMVPQYVNSDVGLLGASGAGIVKVLHDHWHVDAYNISPVEFAQVTQLAGVYAMALGLHNWGLPGGHWSGVRGFDGTQIVLANPGGTGPRFGQQTLTREQFEARAPASCVVLTRKS